MRYRAELWTVTRGYRVEHVAEQRRYKAEHLAELPFGNLNFEELQR